MNCCRHNNARSSSARFAIFETSMSLFCVVFVTTRLSEAYLGYQNELIESSCRPT
ncbi:hypothetical protein T03_6139 [Trichinella britovi]|uniref:Uncharacterized protein n=1 Tax=Trichinella britovi TaxID=45882 RepID=A0A0V1C6A2_TRIBR|nr:hypothetical protein T03_6139 [Trichinella britovi]